MKKVSRRADTQAIPDGSQSGQVESVCAWPDGNSERILYEVSLKLATPISDCPGRDEESEWGRCEPPVEVYTRGDYGENGFPEAAGPRHDTRALDGLKTTDVQTCRALEASSLTSGYQQDRAVSMVLRGSNGSLFFAPFPWMPPTPGVHVLPLHPSGPCFRCHMAFRPACAPPCVSYLTRTPVLLAEGPIPFQYDFIFPDSICKDPISK